MIEQESDDRVHEGGRELSRGGGNEKGRPASRFPSWERGITPSGLYLARKLGGKS